MQTCSDMHIQKKHEGSNQAHASKANMSQALMTTMLNWSLSHAQTSVLLLFDAKAIGGNRVHTYQAASHPTGHKAQPPNRAKAPPSICWFNLHPQGGLGGTRKLRLACLNRARHDMLYRALHKEPSCSGIRIDDTRPMKNSCNSSVMF